MLWKRIGLGLIGSVALLLVGGALYQSICTAWDKKAYPPPGQMFDIGGYKVHLRSMGSGGPAVILESGLGSVSSDLGLVQPEIAKFTQVISYDRAGTGWSEPSPFPRTSGQIVRELHTLLEKAAISKPYILMGHSFGGANVQLYAATYPDEVVGLILVDSCHEEQLQRLPLGPFERQIRWMEDERIISFLSTFGISRLLTLRYGKQTASFLPESMRKVRLALCSTTKHARTIAQEATLLADSFEELARAGRSLIEDKPCFVLTAGREVSPAVLGVSEDQRQAIHEVQLVWKELQDELASKFKRSRHIIAKESDHMIPWHQPKLIVEAAKQLVSEQRPQS